MQGEAGLALAVERVQEERARVVRHRALVQELRRKGHDLKLASELLDTFEQALAHARDEMDAFCRHPAKDRRVEMPEALDA